MGRSQNQAEHRARTLNLSTDEAEKHASRLSGSWEAVSIADPDREEDADSSADSQDVWAFTYPMKQAIHADDRVELPPALPMSRWTGWVLVGGVAFLAVITAVVLVGVDVKAVGGEWVSKLGQVGQERTTTSISAISERRSEANKAPAPMPALAAPAPIPATPEPAPAAPEPAPDLASASAPDLALTPAPVTTRSETRRRPSSRSRRAALQPAPEAPPTQTFGERVTVRFRTVPTDATVRIDGVVVSNPYEGEFQASTAPHRVEVQAPGYKDLATTLAFDSDFSQTLRLHAQITPASTSMSNNADLLRDYDAPQEAEANRAAEEPAHEDEGGLIEDNPY